MSQDKKRRSTVYLKYLSLGIQLMSGVGLAIWLGYWLDKKWAFKIPIFIWVLPIIILIYMLVRLVKDTSKNE